MPTSYPILLLVLALSLPTASRAEADLFSAEVLEQAAQLRDRALATSEAYALVESLTQDVGPRLAGSPGDAKAVAWAETQLKARGFAAVRAEAVQVPRWNRRDVRVERPGEREPLTAVALGGSAATPAEGLVSSVLWLKDVAELQALADEAVRGRIVYFGARMPRSRDGKGYGATVDIRTKGTQLAEAKGAAAVVIRSVGTSNERLAHTGTMGFTDRKARIPAVAVSNYDADRLEAWLGVDPGFELRVFVGARYFDDAVSANVIGEIPGQGALAEEIVLLGAHLDSWDVGQGANDDGAGVAIVIEAATQVARQLQLRPEWPRRTLRVVLFANEEFGLSGSKQYVRDHADDLDRHALAMEADFGSGAVWRLDSAVAEAQLPAVQAMTRLLAPLGVTEGPNDARGAPDIRALRERGVPVLFPYQDGTRYFDVHHTAADTLDSIDPEGLRQNVAVYAVAAWLAALHAPGFGRLEPASAP